MSVTLSAILKIDSALLNSLQQAHSDMSEQKIKTVISNHYTLVDEEYNIKLWSSPLYVDLKNSVVGAFVTSNNDLDYNRFNFYPIAKECLETSNDFSIIALLEPFSLERAKADIKMFKEAMKINNKARWNNELKATWTKRAYKAQHYLQHEFFYNVQQKTEFKTFLNAVLKLETLSIAKLAPILVQANQKYVDLVVGKYNFK